VALAVVNFFTTTGFWWFLFVTFFWGIGLVAHGLSVFMGRAYSPKNGKNEK